MIEIKPATKRDAETVHQMLQALASDLAKEDDYNGSAEKLLEFGFKDKSFFEAIIAWDGTVAVGVALYFFEFSSWRGKPGVYIQDLFVSANARSSGIGRKLTAAVVANAKKEGASYMRLSVDNNNQKAAAFYKAIGFEIVDDEKIFILQGDAFQTLIQ
ncbi:MAG: GNAT family N-acetyltransferase [Kordiimonadaceae bacterium]|jgi:ribosomal protein S18 acetylase RimI-like enzyme|nr:GNAT family N-acetyltransferase [Kordiimonadaceae bacterium]MBT6035721.1 GNAT family N-acetyltransferase [Kordiimonadaceae bacterium]MBT6330554.1 GNAT family N-acetyltransferase [Kordiimonadaceae bacterium]